jgi:hypothetical protein
LNAEKPLSPGIITPLTKIAGGDSNHNTALNKSSSVPKRYLATGAPQFANAATFTLLDTPAPPVMLTVWPEKS